MSVLFCLIALLVAAPNASAYTFGGPVVTQAGPEQTVFDWSTQACEGWDIPDQPARAFRDYQGKVQLLATHYDVRRAVGSDLNSVRHECTVVSHSHVDGDPSHYDDLEWISSLYTLDGRTIYALQHMEYRGWTHNTCTPPSSGFEGTAKCWYNAITLATSTDGGLTYHHAAPPGQLVATAPDTFAAMAGKGPDGVFTPSNIVYRQSDGYYYSLVRSMATPGGREGTCVMRTKTLSNPTSWRAWDGTAFRMRFINPYVETSEPRSAHICQHVSPNEIEAMSESLTYSTYFGKYVLVGTGAPTNPSNGQLVPGIWYSLSDDLIHWTDRRIVMNANVPWMANCGAPNPVRDPSLLDPQSTSRNFETIGRSPNLYFKRMQVATSSGSCYWPQDRDLIRIPIQFSGTPPTASFTSSANSALIGSTVTFDASKSSDPGGQIKKYEWDLNSDGIFERSSTSPMTTLIPSRAGSDTVSLRVTDNDGLEDVVQARQKVDGKINFQPGSASVPAGGYTKDTGAPFSTTRGYGWVRQDSITSTHTPLDLTPNTRDRDASNSDQYDQSLDTFIFMQFPGTDPALVKTPGAFEMALPCATYTVTVSVGDSVYSSSNSYAWNTSTHRINVEGQTAIAGFQPTNGSKFRSATVTVPVCDGRLTVDAIGGTNTKLDYVNVQRASPRVNFQPDAAPVPAGGFAKDAGAPYGDTRGYGWVRQDSLSSPTHTPLNLTPNTRDRDSSNADQYDQSLDTFIFMQFSGSNSTLVKTPGAFEIALPCGIYKVTVSVGDSSYSSSYPYAWNVSTHRINVEGQTAISGFQPTDTTKFRSATVTVPVCDGRLTVDAIGGTNTKLNYVHAQLVRLGP